MGVLNSALLPVPSQPGPGSQEALKGPGTGLRCRLPGVEEEPATTILLGTRIDNGSIF